MAKKKINAWDLDKNELEKKAKEITVNAFGSEKDKAEQKQNILGKDGKKRKMVRIDENAHGMAKAVHKVEGFNTMQEYIEHLIYVDVKSKYETIYNKITNDK